MVSMLAVRSSLLVQACLLQKAGSRALLVLDLQSEISIKILQSFKNSESSNMDKGFGKDLPNQKYVV